MELFRHKRLISVRLQDGSIDNVPKPLLNTMIETHEITEFKRKDGWVVIGRDAIRGMDSGQMPGKERRH